MSRGDSSFQILEKINDNAYKVYLLGEYGICCNLFLGPNIKKQKNQKYNRKKNPKQ
jgi:hypothetical protein